LPAEAGERPERQDGEEVTQRGTTGRVEGEHRGEGRVADPSPQSPPLSRREIHLPRRPRAPMREISRLVA
ncbi:hypothetical protein GQ85_43405, partial [Rhodococcus rhodochrous]